jgi:hypothetical protein
MCVWYAIDLFVSFLFLRQSQYEAQAGIELVILLPLPPKCWDYKACAPVPRLNMDSF